MSAIDFVQDSGFFLVPEYFNDHLCMRLCAEIRSGIRRPAEVVRGGGPYVDPALRRTNQAIVGGTTDARLRDYMEALRPWLARHFRLPLSGFEPVQYLMYGTGDFFGRHIDGDSPTVGAPTSTNSRKISVVIFLNDEGRGSVDESFTGGFLTFFTGNGVKGLPLQAKAGLLVAFPSFIVHEVTTVTCGERFSLTTWFY